MTELIVDEATLTEHEEPPPTGPVPWPDHLGNWIATMSLWLTSLLVIGAVICELLEVIYRYFLRIPFIASSDILTGLFTWITFLALPRAIWFDKSPRLSILKIPDNKIGNVISGIPSGATLGYAIMMFWSYILLLPSQQRTSIPSLGVPTSVEGIAVIVGSVLMATVLLIRLRHTLLGLPFFGCAAGIAAAIIVVRYAPNPEVAALIMLASLLVLNAPIAVALGLAGFVLIIGGNWAEASVPAQQLLQPMENVALLALPLFLLMGGIVGGTRLADSLALLIRRTLGWLPGGTALANVVTAAIFANITGSAIADTAAIGEIYIPQLKRLGYRPEEAGAISAAAGVVGVVFPPATAMILFASAASISVIPVFKAVIIPGFMILIMMGTISLLRGRRQVNIRAGVEKFSIVEFFRALPRSVPILTIPVILDGGILSGIFTPAEAGAVAVLVTVLLIFVIPGVGFTGMGKAMKQAIDSTATVMFIITAVSIIDYGFTVSGVGMQISDILGHFTHSPLLLLLIINLVFMVVHEFIDAGPAILVLVPLITASVLSANINLLQLAVIVAINSTIGAVLPPLGMPVYVASTIAGVPATKVFRITWIYGLGSLVVLIVVVLVPQISLFLPNHF